MEAAHAIEHASHHSRFFARGAEFGPHRQAQDDLESSEHIAIDGRRVLEGLAVKLYPAAVKPGPDG
jgi:hypothetical protein